MPIAALVWFLFVLLGQQPAASTSSASALDYEYFKTRVQPIFLAKRDGHARCVACHSQGTPMRLQPLAAGSTTWSEEDSRKNFEIVMKMVVPGEPLKSQLLIHPLTMDAGGTLFHNGGKHWSSQNNPEWQTIASWIKKTSK
jgi:hypothetical protein